MMRLTVRSILLGVGVAVAIPVDPTTSHDDPKVIVVPLEPAYYPPGQRTTHAYHQATVPTSTPVASDVVPEANAIQALEARRDIIGAQTFRCVAECLHIVPPYLLPIEPRFANCQRHCSQVVGEKIAGDDDDDSHTSLIQALDATPEAIDNQLRCIHRCLETPRDSGPASDHRENPAIAACRRWCSTNSRPEIAGEDDDQDLTSPIEAREALPEPMNPSIWCNVQCHRAHKTDAEMAQCLSKCPPGSGPEFDLQPGGPAPAGFLQARDATPPPSNTTLSCVLECYRKDDKAERAQCYRKCYEERKSKPNPQPARPPSNSSIEVRSVADPDDIAPPGSIECLADCLRGPAQTQEQVDAMAKCMRRCNDALESPGNNNTTTNDTPASSSTIEVRYAAGHPDVIPPPPSIECLLQCIFSPDVNGKDEVEGCERRCNDALGSPGNNNTATNGTLATAPSIQARDASPEVLGEGSCSSGCSAGKHSTLNWLKECLDRCRPPPAEDSSDERGLPATTVPAEPEGPCVNLCIDGLPYKAEASLEACRRWCAKSQHPEANEIFTAAVAGQDEEAQLEDAPAETDLKPLLCLMDCMKSLPDGDDEGRKECRRRCAPGISRHPKANETLTAAAVPDNNNAAQDQEDPYSALPSVVCLIGCMLSLPGDGDDKGRDECARRCIPGRNTTTTTAATAATTLDNGPIGSSTTTNEAREVHPGDLFRSSSGDPECEPNCLKAIPPESTEERRRCLRRCCPTRGQGGKSAHEDAHPEEEDVAVVLAAVEKRDCGSDCIANSHSKPEETACFQKCQDKGQLNFTDPTGQQPPSPI